MIKLDVSSDPSSPGYELVKNASPLVMYFLSSSSSQARGGCDKSVPLNYCGK